MANRNSTEQNQQSKSKTSPLIVRLRVLSVLVLIAGAFWGAVHVRRQLYTSGSGQSDYQVGFLGDSILGLGASKASPYHFLRNFLEEAKINAVSLSQPALSSISARNSLGQSRAFEGIDTFVVMLGRSEVPETQLKSDLGSLKKANVDTETRAELERLEKMVVDGEVDTAKAGIKDLGERTANPTVRVFLQVWLFSLDPKKENFPGVLERLESRPDTPLKFYSIVRRALASKGLEDENGQILSRMLARYGRQPDIVAALAWHENRKGCNQAALDLFEESIRAGAYDLRTIYHVFGCYRELGQKDRRTALIQTLAKDPGAPEALRILAKRGADDDDSSGTDPHQKYMNDLYKFEKAGDTERLKERYLGQSEEEGSEKLHTSRALPTLVRWMLDSGKTVVYVSYPNDTVPQSIQQISNPHLKIIDTKKVLAPYLSQVPATQLLADDYEHFSVLGSCLLATEISKELGVPSKNQDPLSWCESQR